MKVSNTGHILSSTTVDVPSEHAGEASNQILMHLEETGVSLFVNWYFIICGAYSVVFVGLV